MIALTLRHDRLDNFWFTLFHEVMHVVLHLRGKRGEGTTSFAFSTISMLRPSWEL